MGDWKLCRSVTTYVVAELSFRLRLVEQKEKKTVFSHWFTSAKFPADPKILDPNPSSHRPPIHPSTLPSIRWRIKQCFADGDPSHVLRSVRTYRTYTHVVHQNGGTLYGMTCVFIYEIQKIHLLEMFWIPWPQCSGMKSEMDNLPRRRDWYHFRNSRDKCTMVIIVFRGKNPHVC